MTNSIDFYFDFPSPYAYLAHTQLPRIAAEHGATIVYHPFRILELMKIVGNRPTTIECKNKSKYAGADLQRWVKRYKVGFARNPNSKSFDFAALDRAALVAIADGRGADYVAAIFAAIWGKPEDLSQRTVLQAVLMQAADLVQLSARPALGRVEKRARARCQMPASGATEHANVIRLQPKLRCARPHEAHRAQCVAQGRGMAVFHVPVFEHEHGDTERIHPLHDLAAVHPAGDAEVATARRINDRGAVRFLRRENRERGMMDVREAALPVVPLRRRIRFQIRHALGPEIDDFRFGGEQCGDERSKQNGERAGGHGEVN